MVKLEANFSNFRIFNMAWKQLPQLITFSTMSKKMRKKN